MIDKLSAKQIMANAYFSLKRVHPSWRPALKDGLAAMDAAYLKNLSTCPNWLPGPQHIFNALSLPVDRVQYVLLGESPYPRPESANGYAFWDAAVKTLWSPKGMSKMVNRATSFRNILKMLLLAEGAFNTRKMGQPEIAQINKAPYVQSCDELFANFFHHGFLLLNATLVLQKARNAKNEARAWSPCIRELLNFLLKRRKSVKFILFGQVAKTLESLVDVPPDTLYAEHPYNCSFITNPNVLDFFRPLHLLRKQRASKIQPSLL